MEKPNGCSLAAAAPLLAAVFVSGFCGISYEILYARLLSNLLGSHFAVSASILVTFLLGIGIGTKLAHHLARWLWAIELAIGAWALLVLHGLPRLDMLLFSAPYARGLACQIGLSCALLAVPALGVGMTLPLFAGLLTRALRRRVFALTYTLYNFGAALTALAAEFVLVRTFGIAGTVWLVALLNYLLGFALFLGRYRYPPQQAGVSPRFPARSLIALACLGVASAVFQLFMIMMAQFVFGPFQETFAMVLFVVLLGIAIGSTAAHLRPIPFGALLGASIGSILLVMGLFRPAVHLYAAFQPSFAGASLVGWRILILLLVMGPASACFGAAIPALLRSEGYVSRDAGKLLFVSSLANVAGYLLMAFVLHEHLEYGEILTCTALILAAALALYSWPGRRPLLAAAGLLALPLPVLGRAWDEDLLYGSHMDFESLQHLTRRRAERAVEQRFRRHEEALSVLSYRGRRYLYFNGYYSTEVNYLGEHAVGIMSVLVSPRLEEALVLGLGTGSTAGSVSQYFGHTDIVEISQLIIDHQDLFARNSFEAVTNPSVQVVCDDGIRYLKRTDRTYDLIVNTVTNPQYFSSSKLYTRDFFRLVKSRLRKEGVYTTWIGTSVGNRGTEIILATLRSEFRYCWVGIIRSHYLLLLCSNTPLGLRQEEAVAANARVRRYFAERGTDLPLLRYCFVSDDAYGALDPRHREQLNTLDRPTLEFEIARIKRLSATTLGRLRRYIKNTYDPGRLNRTIFRNRPLDPLELALYYEQLGAPSYDRKFFRRVAARELGITLRPLQARLRAAALESRRRAVEEFPGAWTLAEWGETLRGADRLEEAAEAFERALEKLDPRNPPPHLWFEFARTLERLQRHERARELYREQVEHTPRWATAHYRLGRAEFRLRQPRGCIRSMHACLAADPFYEEANAYLGRSYLLLGERSRALEHFERELAIDPNDAEVKRLASMLRAERKPTEGLPGV